MSDSLEINSNNSISIVDNDAIVLATNNAIDIKYSEPEYDVTVNKKEYIITGDTLYIPKRYEDTPQWLRDIIDSITDIALSAKISEINNLTQSLNNLIDELNVAKNTYTMSIISSNDINERINTAVETLNSSMMESDSTIIRLATTRVTPEQAQAISIDALRTSLNDTISGNSLGSIISEIKSTTTTGDYTNAQSIEVLKSTVEGNADATASAIDTINTFAGIDETGAYTYTGLTGYLADPNTGMIGGGQSELQNTITTTGDKVEAKFEYGSNIKIGGQYHNAGFGLKTTMTGGDGTIADPYNSEFWINAEKFKFTNNNKTGSKSPFTIDATGSVPEITFNGLVTFNSVDSVYSSKLTTNTNTNNDVFAQRLGYMNYADMVSKATAGQTIINGGYLRGELIEANSITAGQINAYAITGKQITGGTINGTDINGVRITGAIIKASFIDYTSNLALSNWQYFTPSNVPVAYIGNFAHHNDGSLLVDSQGYVRLPAQSGFKTTGTIKTLGGDIAVGGGSTSVPYNATYNEAFNVYPWDDYTINTLNRAIYPEVNTTYLSGEFRIDTYCTIRNYDQRQQGIDGSHNYYDFYIKFLGDTIQGHAYINTNSSGTNSWRSWYVNGAGVGTGYSKTIKGITYTLSSEIYTHDYTKNGNTYIYGYGWKFTITADFTGNKNITSYNFDDLIKVVRSEGSLYVSPDEPSKAYVCKFEHAVKYPVLNIL